MKTIKFVYASALIVVFASLMGCGLQDGPDGSGNTPAPAPTNGNGGDAGITNPPIPGTTPSAAANGVLPDPFRTDRPCNLNFSQRYISGATTGEMRGTMPMNTWTAGMKLADDNQDGYIGMQWLSKTPVGTFEVSYVGFQGADTNPAWAQYGLAEDISRMSAEGRKFVNCNWYDASKNVIVSVSQPTCNIRFSVDEACNVKAAGNMGNFTAR